MIASECEPFAKTGGLADVVDALSRALGAPPPRGLGHDVDVFMPWYRGVEPPRPLEALELAIPVSGSRRQPVPVWSGPTDGYRLRLVEHAPSFDREGLYMAGGRD